jgi:PAS domain S-box-containing protein
MIHDPVKTRTFHILIVDDEEESIPVFRNGFSLWAKMHRLSFAQTNEDACYIVSTDPPDIIFIALKFLTKAEPLITPGEEFNLPYPIIIIVSQNEKKDAILASAYGELEILVRSDRMWSVIPHACDRCLREWRWIQLKNAGDFELERVREEISGRNEELQTQFEELRDSNSRLEQSELRFRQLFTENVAGYALHEITCDDQGIPIDYRFLDLNPAFERMTGLLSKNITGKTVKEVLPDIESFWIDTYGKVALTRESIHFENYTAALDRYYEVTAYSPQPGRFATVVLDVTDRKRSEITLHDREERLRLTLDAINDGIWDWNIPTGSAFFSARWYTMLGYDPDAMPATYDTWRSLIHPDDLSLAEKKIQDHISHKDEGYTVEVRMLTRTGDYKWILTRGKVVERDEGGCPVRMVGTHTDISDRKGIETELTKKHYELGTAYEQLAAGEEELKLNLYTLLQNEQKLRISEERLLMAQTIGHSGSWEYNLQTGQIWGSAEAFRIYGFPAVEGEIDIEKIEACIPERELVHQALEDLITQGFDYNLEFVIHPADGSSPRIIQSRARMESDDHGRPVTVTGIILDITEQKKKEEVLRETNAYLETLIHYSNVPIVVWDSSFRITRFNRACEQLTGLTADEARGKHLDILLPPSQKTQSMRLIHTTLEGVRWESVEIDIQHVSGLIRTVSWNSSIIYSTDGITPIAVIAQGQNVTEKKRLEKEKEVALNQIQQNIAQLSILNDGIRNPLTIISLNADAMGETKQTRQIIDEVGRIDEMVRQLDYRWMESEKIFRFLQKHYQISMPDSLPSSEKANWNDFHSNTEEFNPIRIQEVQAELFTILDSIDALVYVADMNTHELLFMNKKGRKTFGDIIGKRCYETIQQNHHSVCPFCTNHLLVGKSGPTGVYQWEFFNPDTKRWYDCRDRAIRWVDGRIVRLEIATDITERKQVLEELRRSEEQLLQITDTISVAYYVFDRESNHFIYASPAYEIIWKRSRSELYIDSHSFFETIHPEDRKFVQEAVRRELEEDAFLDIEYRIILPDGTVRWIHSHDFPVRNDQGVSYRIAGFAEDITSRKKAEEELLLQSQIVQNMAEGVVMISAMDGNIVYANPRFEKMFGYEPGELTGKPVSTLNAPDERPSDTIAREIMESLTRTGTWSGEIQNIRKDGTTFWCYANVSTCMHHQYGEVWISVHEDISKRKEIESVLQESEEKYRTLTERVHDGIYIYQRDAFVYVNNRVSEITGYTKEELYTLNFWKIVHPEDRHQVLEIAKKRDSGRTAPQTYEVRIITKPGTIKTLELAVSDISYHGEYAALCAARDITNQKEVEVSLRETTERYMKLVQNIPDYILVHRNGIILFVNHAAARSFGYTSDELIGSDIMRYLTEESQKRVSELMPRRVAGETFPSYEITILTKDGIPKITEVHGVLIQFEGGPASLNVLTDVTEQHRVMRELKENEEKFRNIFDMMNDGIHIHEILPDGSPGRFIDLNRVACEMVGYSREEMLRHSPLDFSTEYHSLALDEIIGELSGADHTIFETRLIRKDGPVIPVEINAHKVRLQGKEVIVSVVRDITLRKQVEDALRESETKYRQLVENANEAIVVAQDGMMKLVNARMIDLTGFSESELLSRPFTDFIHPEDQALVLETHYRRLAGESPPSRYTFRLIKKDKAITWVEISAVLIQWEGIPATLDFLINITDRKQAEEAVRESNKKLRLLTGLTRHDIFNQVSAAHMFTDLAIKSSDISQIHKYLSHSQEAHERIETIIGFTREYEDFGVVSSGWQNVYNIIERANREISFGSVEEESLIPEDLEVYADPIIRKVFTTLIENAIRHGGTITRIRIHCHEEGDHLMMFCSDNGKGIPADEKESIFEHGYGTHTGIGLFLAREILSITGLSIRECGEEGEGAQFEILVPKGKFRFYTARDE